MEDLYTRGLAPTHPSHTKRQHTASLVDQLQSLCRARIKNYQKKKNRKTKQKYLHILSADIIFVTRERSWHPPNYCGNLACRQNVNLRLGIKTTNTNCFGKLHLHLFPSYFFLIFKKKIKTPGKVNQTPLINLTHTKVKKTPD